MKQIHSRPWLALILLPCLLPIAWGRGVSPYLPLNINPEMERQIERVLILADKPVMKRPIATATVFDALPKVCKIDEALCQSVHRYLARYMDKLGVSDASIEAAAADQASAPLANQHGIRSDSPWRVSAHGYWQPSDYALVSLGGLAYEDDSAPNGSMLSLGFEYAQLDAGYRDHWFSPFTDSSMLIGTEARTLPSVTLSNYTPITRLGLHYEVFLAEMEYSDSIQYQGGFTAGRPRLAGLRLAIEPAPGWSLGANRLMQFGGGARGGTSASDFLRALFKPHEYDNITDPDDAQFGNQLAAWTSRFIFPGRTPFAAYLEYAGEDSSYEGNYRLGNSALSIGLTFPRLWKRFDLTYEASEWQNGWYVSSLYGDGLTTQSHVIGHWGADQRLFGDAVGAKSQMLRLGWDSPFGGYLQTLARTVVNENYGATSYERAYELSVSYSRALSGFTVGAEVQAGKDVFGEDYGRLAAFARLGDEWSIGSADGYSGDIARPQGAELFVDAGVNASKVWVRLGDGTPTFSTGVETAPHIGIGARRAVSDNSDLGVRAELDRIDGQLMIAMRALDYRYRFNGPLALSAFLGAARYDLATPAYGYYYGMGLHWREMLPHLDLNVELRHADKVARDKLLPGDPASTLRPDAFYDIAGGVVSLSYKF